MIEQGIKRCFSERVRLERYIQGVPDSEMRMILTLRYINGLSFQQIAFSIGYQDESVPRKRHDRFLKRTEEERGGIIKKQEENSFAFSSYNKQYQFITVLFCRQKSTI